MEHYIKPVFQQEPKMMKVVSSLLNTNSKKEAPYLGSLIKSNNFRDMEKPESNNRQVSGKIKNEADQIFDLLKKNIMEPEEKEPDEVIALRKQMREEQ